MSRLTAENIDVQEKKNWFNCKGYMVWTTRTEDGKTIEQFDRVKTGKTCQNNDKKMVKKCANEITAKLSSARQEINNRKNSINFNKLFGNN